MEQERRSFVRRPARGDVFCRLDRLGMGPQHRGRLLEISQSGAWISLSISVDIGQELHLEFPASRAGKPFVTSATVIKVEEQEDGGFQIAVELHSRLPYECFLDLTR